MAEFFPPGFWSTVCVIGMVVFFLFGVDLLFGAKVMIRISRTLDKKFHVDQAIMQALEDLKRRSDKEFNVDRSLMHGWGRFVMSGLLFFGALMILLNIMPVFK